MGLSLGGVLGGLGKVASFIPGVGNVAGAALQGAGALASGKGLGGAVKGAISGLGGPIGAAATGAGILGSLFGKPKTQYTNPVPQDVQGLRSGLSNYLQGQYGTLTPTAQTAQGAQAQGPGLSNPNYNGLQGMNFTQSTQPVNFNGLQYNGNGQSGQFINQLANGQAQNSLLGLNQQASQTLLNPQQVGGGHVQGIDPTQSINELGTGFASQFMQNYNPLFEQQRQQALAAAKEASGNLTGSGFANALGNATAQTLGQQQAQLANLAQFGIGQETGRQQNMAGLQNQRNIVDAQNALQAGISNQNAGLQGAQAYGNLAQNQNQSILQALGLNQQGLGQALTGEQNNLNRQQDTSNRSGELGLYGGLQNRQITSGEQQNNQQLDYNRQLQLAQLGQNNAQFNAGQTQQNNQFYGQLGQQNNQFNAGQQNQIAGQNANTISGLMGQMATAGVGVPQAYQQPNFFQSLAGGLTNLLPYVNQQGGQGGQGGQSAPYIGNNVQPRMPITSGGQGSFYGPQGGGPAPSFAQPFNMNGGGAPNLNPNAAGGIMSSLMGGGSSNAQQLYPAGVDPQAAAADPQGYAKWLADPANPLNGPTHSLYSPSNPPPRPSPFGGMGVGGFANPNQQASGLLNSMLGGGQGAGTQSGLWNRPTYMNALPNMAVNYSSGG